MPDLRTLIAADVLQALQAITVANGHSVDVVTVERGAKLWGSVPAGQRPYLGVLLGVGRQVAAASRQIKWAMEVRVIGYLALAKDLPVPEYSAALHAYMEDVKRALLADPSRDGSAVGTMPTVEGTDEPSDIRVGAIEMVFEVNYWTSLTEF